MLDMKRKVYVVYNEALHQNSSFHEVVDVFATQQEAIDAIGCMSYDFQREIDRGEHPEFDDYKERLDDPRWESIVETNDGYYEAWRIYEKEVEL